MCVCPLKLQIWNVLSIKRFGYFNFMNEFICCALKRKSNLFINRKVGEAEWIVWWRRGGIEWVEDVVQLLQLQRVLLWVAYAIVLRRGIFIIRTAYRLHSRDAILGSTISFIRIPKPTTYSSKSTSLSLIWYPLLWASREHKRVWYHHKEMFECSDFMAIGSFFRCGFESDFYKVIALCCLIL